MTGLEFQEQYLLRKTRSQDTKEAGRTSYNRHRAGSTPKFGVPNFALCQPLAETTVALEVIDDASNCSNSRLWR